MVGRRWKELTDQPTSDDGFEQQLRDAARDPVPDDLVRISAGLFTWRTIDAELAQLDLGDVEATAGVRGGEPTTATFVLGDRVIEVELSADGELIVDLGGRWAEAVAIYTPEGAAATAATDEAVVAHFAQVPTGPLQFIVTAAGGVTIKTRWVTF
jgi:hypothetical protein